MAFLPFSRYVYERIAPRGRKPGFQSLLFTQLVSAVWHGLYAGYMLFFAGTAVWIYFSQVRPAGKGRSGACERREREAYGDQVVQLLVQPGGGLLVTGGGLWTWGGRRAWMDGSACFATGDQGSGSHDRRCVAWVAQASFREGLGSLGNRR